MIIYLIGKQINETVSAKPYSAYEEVEEALLTPRGKINFNRYTTSLTYGRHQFIDCDYNSFGINFSHLLFPYIFCKGLSLLQA